MQHEQEAREYKSGLLTEISYAREIRITEHSSPLDSPDLRGSERIYRTKVLSADGKARLLLAVREMDSAPQEAFAACVPEYHHTFEFLHEDGKKTVLKICFQCSQVEWIDGQAGDNPIAIFDTLGTFLESEGMQRKRDWKKLAGEPESQP